MIDGANENDNENEYMKQQLTAIYFVFQRQLSAIYQQLISAIMIDFNSFKIAG